MDLKDMLLELGEKLGIDDLKPDDNGFFESVAEKRGKAVSGIGIQMEVEEHHQNIVFVREEDNKWIALGEYPLRGKS